MRETATITVRFYNGHVKTTPPISTELLFGQIDFILNDLVGCTILSVNV